MKTTLCPIFIALAFPLLLLSCSTTHSGKTTGFDTIPTDKVITAAEQKALTPDAILLQLKEGNNNFVNNKLTLRNYPAQVQKTAIGQFPKAVILSCLDSRIPVEEVFDQGIGDVFVARVAGNIVNEDILGSMEFGTKVVGAKLIVVMGHNHCGAVKSAIDDVQLGNITAMLSKVKPAVAACQNFSGEKTSKNNAFVDEVGHRNVNLNIEKIKNQSPIIKSLVDNGDIKIVGAFYNLETGKVEFVN